MAASWFAKYHIPNPWEAGYQAPGTGEDEETPPGNITPAKTNYTPSFGGKPAVPNPANVLSDVIGSNLGMMPDIKNLGRKASNYFWNQTTKRVPGYEDMAAQSARNIGAQLRGEIPADVLYNLGQGAAERGISTGGGFSNSDYLRSLGLTSLGLMGEGEKGLTGALQRAESVPLFDISKYMLSPQDVYNARFQANVIGAAPDPAAAGALALSTVNRGAAGTPGRVGGMPSIGGGGGGALTPGYNWNANVGMNPNIGTTPPPTSTYNPWGPGGWAGGAVVPGSSNEGSMTDADLEALFGGGLDFGGDYYDYGSNPETSFDYSGYA